MHAPGQVVDLPAPREEKRPDSAKFVSEHDSCVERETKKYGRFEDNARQGDASGTAATSQPAMPDGGRAAGDANTRSRSVPARRDRARRAPPARAGRPGSSYGALNAGEPRSARRLFPSLGAEALPKQGGGARGGSGLALVPTDQQLARAIGCGDAGRAAPTSRTATRRRSTRRSGGSLRSSTASSGRSPSTGTPRRSYRQRDPTGMIYGSRNRYTELRIQLKPDGRLGNVAVCQPSGLEFLDDEAIEAFKEAAPFPNPPRQLIEANGLINFGFGFLFDLNGPPEMRWFKY